jgi:hypothetical protein
MISKFNNEVGILECWNAGILEYWNFGDDQD